MSLNFRSLSIDVKSIRPKLYVIERLHLILKEQFPGYFLDDLHRLNGYSLLPHQAVYLPFEHFSDILAPVFEKKCRKLYALQVVFDWWNSSLQS